VASQAGVNSMELVRCISMRSTQEVTVSGRVSRTSAPYSGCPGFKSRAGQRILRGFP
jgi:hypothetical protein